jgi:hypothetical protein
MKRLPGCHKTARRHLGPAWTCSHCGRKGAAWDAKEQSQGNPTSEPGRRRYLSRRPHDRLWHITTKKNFKIDPSFHPRLAYGEYR